MTAILKWLSKAIETIYHNDGLLGALIALAFVVLVLWWLGIDGTEIAAWLGFGG